MREYTGDQLKIDGRMICYRLVTATDYLRAKGLTEDEAEAFVENKYSTYELINQIMALKQSCFMLRRTSYSCGSLSDGLYRLKVRLIRELREEHRVEFDDAFVERNGQPQKTCAVCNQPDIELHDGTKRHGEFYAHKRDSSDHAPTDQVECT